MGRRIDPRLRIAATDYYFQNGGRYSIRRVAEKYGVAPRTLQLWIKHEQARYPDFKNPNTNPNESRIKKLCETDLLYLAREILGYKRTKLQNEGITDPPDPVHVAMAQLRNRPERFKLGMFPRETYKTTVLIKAGVIQDLLRNPDETILIASEPWQKARDILKEIKQQLLYNKKLTNLYGEFKPKRNPDLGSLWNKNEIYIKQRVDKKLSNLTDASVSTTGVVDADVTGKHPRKIYIDDPVIPRNITTFEMKQKVINFLIRCFHLAGPSGRLMLDGTPYTYDDGYAYTRKEWVDRLDPSTGGQLFYSMVMGIQDEHGNSIMPSKFPLSYIEFLKNTLPLNEYATQYVCNPKAGGNTLVKPEDYAWLETTAYHSLPALKDPDWYAYMGIDPGASLSPKKCYTGIVVGIPDPPYDLYIDEAKRIKAEPSIVIDEVIKILQRPLYRDRIRKIGVEVASFQKVYKGSIENALRRAGIYGVSCVPLKPNDSKDRRIYSTEPYFRHHQVHFRQGLHDALRQVGGFPHLGENDLDILDALEMVIRILPPTFMINPTGIIPVSENVVDKRDEGERRIIKDELHGYAIPEEFVYREVEAF